MNEDYQVGAVCGEVEMQIPEFRFNQYFLRSHYVSGAGIKYFTYRAGCLKRDRDEPPQK